MTRNCHVWFGGQHRLTLSIFNMRGPGLTMHRLPLFVWSVLVTAFPLLSSPPVLAGVFAPDEVAMPWSNLTICWKLRKDNQQGTNHDGSPSETIRQTSLSKTPSVPLPPKH